MNPTTSSSSEVHDNVITMPDVDNDDIKSNSEWLKYYRYYVKDYLLLQLAVTIAESNEDTSDSRGETIMDRSAPYAVRCTEWPDILGKSYPNVSSSLTDAFNENFNEVVSDNTRENCTQSTAQWLKLLEEYYRK